jgi:hypothetical protein
LKPSANSSASPTAAGDGAAPAGAVKAADIAKAPINMHKYATGKFQKRFMGLHPVVGEIRSMRELTGCGVHLCARVATLFALSERLILVIHLRVTAANSRRPGDARATAMAG